MKYKKTEIMKIDMRLELSCTNFCVEIDRTLFILWRMDTIHVTYRESQRRREKESVHEGLK